MFILRDVKFSKFIHNDLNERHILNIEYLDDEGKKCKKHWKNNGKIIYLEGIKKITKARVGYNKAWKNVLPIMLKNNMIVEEEDKGDKVTVVINSYNPDKKDLYKSIKSVLNQVNVNVTILVSTVENDRTIKYIKKLNNYKVKLVISLLNEHPGRGPKGIFFQLNKAIKEVKTKYFSYFSSNDVMYPEKLYNEINLIKESKAIFCFSRFESYYPESKKTIKYCYPTDKMNLVNLMRKNYINDCATIDISQLEEPLQFNYEKYGNCAYWHLWLTLLHKYGENCMVINENVGWKYIRDDKKSQAIQRSNDIDKQELYNNQREFMLSEFDAKINPRSLYKYNDINEKFWWWNDESNEKPVEMTVALPALNANKIIWLALESLKSQINITFAWELIVFEEEGVSKEIVQSYAGLLPGCVRIIYKTITREDAFYKLEDIKKNECTSYYTLLEKWINMAKISDSKSKIFVKHAVDCYSPPKRLFIHYEHFKNDMCYYSTQPKGYFYNINLDKWLLYDGYKLEPINWHKYGPWQINYLDNNYIDDPTISIRGCHLNMALRTNIMKLIPISPQPKRNGLDGYILYNMSPIIGYRPEETKIVFTDDEIDEDNWKYSIDTDGCNNISSRDKFYKKDPKYARYNWYVPFEDNYIFENEFIPKDILIKLQNL